MKLFNVKNDEFYKCNPFVNLIYFIYVIGLTMFFLHPIFLAISLLVVIINLRLYQSKIHFTGIVSVLLMVMLFNVLVNHQGKTILFYMFYGNPITLESVLYGISAGCMLISVVLWFMYYMKIVSSDKFIYISTMISKKLSLFFSMIIRFVPLLSARLKEVYCVQKLIYSGKKNKLILAFQSFYITAAWAVESSITTADSMNARGYELKGRTSFSNYRFCARDIILLIVMSGIFVFLIFLIKYKWLYIRYFPLINVKTTLVGILMWGLLLCMPIIINIFSKG